ncbi:bifunctional alpha/beta hydrolase/OsmC family protein [Limibaculum sp. FT325]|uniref:bifunctional alpha/beta hydrolase/OsmC family protein n=1 Tax=Thermohalobaculum sediminis TaxID=2939436 RepID=UPI0020BDE697|nr:bifunctional alpha/beta hydrolase/OsmC family protein [Limibaculum sediminis]MCL5777496.1 bifunctional alpha/beta hydrolase/OsmC family protein [Limibaculum sediminis]
MRGEKFTFAGHSGEPLAARFDRPEGRVKAVALFAHCFTCGKDIAAARRIAGRLSALGIGVLRFDFTGLGHSGGEFANTGFCSNVADIVAAARYLDSRNLAPQILVGHSLGGAAVLVAADALPSVEAVAVIGAPSDPAHVLEHFGPGLAEIEAEGAAEVMLAGRPVTIGRGLVEELRGTDLLDKVAKLRRALLILHAPRDMVVGIENAGRIFGAAMHPKSFVSLDDADHLLSRAEDADYAAGVIAAWAARYLHLGEALDAGAPPEGVVRTVESDPSGFLQDIAVAPGLAIRADEPASVGGSGLGASPYQLLAAGLGACTSMTIRMYARRKGWPLEGVTVDVSHGKTHAEDSAGAEEGRKRIDLFRRVIRLDGPLDDEQRARLMEIADRCPVHRTLESGARIETVEARYGA